MPEYTPPSRQLISHELAELQEAEAMEKEIRDYMERRQRSKVVDPLAGQDFKPRVLLMSQHQYNDIVSWGKSMEEEKMRIDKFLIRQQVVTAVGRPVGPRPDETRALQTFGSRAARRLDAKMRRKEAKKVSCR